MNHKISLIFKKIPFPAIMIKKLKFMFITLAILLSIVSIYWLGNMVLNQNSLTFRPWVTTFTVVSSGIVNILFLISLILVLIQVIKLSLKNEFVDYLKKLICVFGILGCILAIIASGWYTLIGGAFSCKPEHIVERDGRKMIACVNSFMDVDVDYHEYKNIFAMGSKILISEDYGSGGYDPLEKGKECTPKRTTYYYDR